MTNQTPHDRINHAILTGKSMAAFEELYADNVIMQENSDPPCVGKDANRRREQAMAASVEAWHDAKLLTSAVEGDVSFSEWELDVTFKGAPRMTMAQVSVRRWKHGKVVDERFYHK